MTREIHYDLSRRPVQPSIGFYAYDATGLITLGTGGTDINFDTEVYKDSTYFSFTAGVAPITLNIAGYYEISYYMGTGVSSGSAATLSQSRLMKDTGGGYAEIGGTRGAMQNPTSTDGYAASAMSIIHYFNAGDLLKLQGIRTNGTNTIATLANSTGILIKAFKLD